MRLKVTLYETIVGEASEVLSVASGFYKAHAH